VIKIQNCPRSKSIAHRIKAVFVPQAQNNRRSTDNRAASYSPPPRNCAFVHVVFTPGIASSLSSVPPVAQPASRDHRHKGPAKPPTAGAA